jgi:hypothetical protein
MQISINLSYHSSFIKAKKFLVDKSLLFERSRCGFIPDAPLKALGPDSYGVCFFRNTGERLGKR